MILQSLGNQPQADHGQALLAASSRRKSWLAYGLLGIGGLLVIFNVIRRLVFRYKTNPLEMEYTA